MTRFLMVLSIMGLAFSVPAMLDYDTAWAKGGTENGDNGDDNGDDNGEDNGHGGDDGENGDDGGDEGDGGDDGEDNGDNGDSPGPSPEPGPGAAAEPAGEGETRVVDQEGATTNDREDVLRFLKNGVNTLVRVIQPPCAIEQALSFGDSAHTCLIVEVFDTTSEE